MRIPRALVGDWGHDALLGCLLCLRLTLGSNLGLGVGLRLGLSFGLVGHESLLLIDNLKFLPLEREDVPDGVIVDGNPSSCRTFHCFPKKYVSV